MSDEKREILSQFTLIFVAKQGIMNHNMDHKELYIYAPKLTQLSGCVTQGKRVG